MEIETFQSPLDSGGFSDEGQVFSVTIQHTPPSDGD
jgi:hypothetical protein